MTINHKLIGVNEVHALSGIPRKTLLAWASDGRFPKYIKRRYSNAPYLWREAEVMRWLAPQNCTEGLTEEQVKTIVRTELIRLLRSTAPAGH